MPVRVKKTRQNKRLEPGSDSIRTDKALELGQRFTSSGQHQKTATSSKVNGCGNVSVSPIERL
jgi:hypothetical protein